MAVVGNRMPDGNWENFIFTAGDGERAIAFAGENPAVSHLARTFVHKFQNFNLFDDLCP